MNASLLAILSRYLAPARPVRTPAALGNAGGMSGASLWRFESALGPLVLRAWPSDVSRGHVEAIHARLRHAAKLDFLPHPIAALDGSTVLEEAGRAWELSPWMPGRPDLATPPRREHVIAGFQGLARFHLAISSWQKLMPAPGLVERAKEARKLGQVHLASWRRTVSQGPDDALRGLALQWLDAAEIAVPRISAELREATSIPVPVQFVIRDARPDHFLFTEDRLTGLVDFGAMGFDSAAADLARLISEWLGQDRDLRSLALSSYGQVRPLSQEEVSLIDVYARSSALLGGGHWVRWHFLDRRAFEDPSAVLRGLERGVARVLDLLARAGSFSG